MKQTFLIIFFSWIISACYSQDFIDSSIVPALKIEKKQIPHFIDSLKKRIFLDTLLFSRKDLYQTYNATRNTKPYSALYIINFECKYKLDIIEGNLVNEFIREFLDPSKIESIVIVDSSKVNDFLNHPTSLGVVFIDMKKKLRVNYKVGGLKKKFKKEMSSNFNQRNPGEPYYGH